MKSIIFSLGLMITSQAAFSFGSNNYYRDVVDFRDIDQHMVHGSASNNTPEKLQGLWWMDGNSLPGEIISFAGAEFKEIINSGEVTGYLATVHVYDEGVWSWHNTTSGKRWLDIVTAAKLVYQFSFNADFTKADIIPTFKPLPLLGELVIPQSQLLDFSMTETEPGIFRRDSVVLGAASSGKYSIRRIVDGEGLRTEAYDLFLEHLDKIGVEEALLPMCEEAPESLPTSCARN